MQTVELQFNTGLKRKIFRNARLCGSWDGNGRYSDIWSESPMREDTGTDGCPMFKATVSLDLADKDKTFKWGVLLDGPQGANFWGVPTELQDADSTDRYRQFQLAVNAPTQVERYYFTYGRRLGANKYFTANGAPGLRFAVWAPNAQKVDVVFGTPAGYIADDGKGIDPKHPVVALTRAADGIWEGAPQGSFESFKSHPYMYRISNAQGETVYRTDIFSRSQIGKGSIDPAKGNWPGTVDTLDGTVSCSVVIDPDVIRRDFASTPAGKQPPLIPATEFWACEFTFGLPLPTRLDDLVIYELHIGSLGFGKPGPGDLGDAIAFLDHLVDLGVNAVELLPMAEFSGNVAWGYGDTHHFCIEASAGGRDKYRHFVRECHRRGIAVIQDVVYNHYDPNSGRAQWAYDSNAPEQNIYYWYEGMPGDYPAFEAAAELAVQNHSTDPARPISGHGGYLDNGSTGYCPRFCEEVVRQQFISSAAFLIEEMHVDGLRVDLTQALHRDNVLHADGRSVGTANSFGQKFLREWSRALRMIHPNVMLIAEDHTGWDAVTKLPANGGLGFEARWAAEFYHNLIGDAKSADGKARLLKQAGYGGNEPLEMDRFAGALSGSSHNQVVYHESHDEAGNAEGTERTIETAINGAALDDATRPWAEARSRVSFGLSLLSAGTPMFFMGEEIGAKKNFTYNNFKNEREDILGERLNSGKSLFRYYQDIITLGRRQRSIRSHNIDILHQSNANRVIAFKRWSGDEEVIVVASLNNAPFANGYVVAKDPLAIPDGAWKEIFNSDASVYGGHNMGNGGTTILSSHGCINTKIPANGFVVLARQ
ncbi:MAG: alpha amylase C-terminal domain-containing protein [Nitrosomonadales bacterium]|nr:alpha amylase C-terminal domain-containing protein [Nitrosomonadales bacterium]